MSTDMIKQAMFVNVYPNEVWSIAASIQALEQRLNDTDIFKKIASKKEGYTHSPSVEPHEIVSSILGNTSRLHKLFMPTNQRRGESDAGFENRKARAKFLRELLLEHKKGGYEIYKSSIRNAIEHFDERIDLLNDMALANAPELKLKIVLCNFTVSSEKAFTDWAQVIPIKVLVHETGDYFMVDEKLNVKSVNLFGIFKEVESIRKKCEEWGRNFAGEGIKNPIGIMRPIM